MLIALALATAVAQQRVATLEAALRPSACVTAACNAEPRRSRYRLAPQDETPVDIKYTALATDGSACSVIGGKVCTHKPRTIFVTDFTD